MAKEESNVEKSAREAALDGQLACACALGDVARALALAECGADPGRRGAGGGCAWIAAAVSGGPALCSALALRSCPLRARDAMGRTALAAAAMSGQSKTVELLAGMGFGGSEQDFSGMSALMHAAFGGFGQCCAYLARRFPDSLGLRDKQGFAALHWALAGQEAGPDGAAGVLAGEMRARWGHEAALGQALEGARGPMRAAAQRLFCDLEKAGLGRCAVLANTRASGAKPL